MLEMRMGKLFFSIQRSLIIDRARIHSMIESGIQSPRRSQKFTLRVSLTSKKRTKRTSFDRETERCRFLEETSALRSGKSSQNRMRSAPFPEWRSRVHRNRNSKTMLSKRHPRSMSDALSAYKVTDDQERIHVRPIETLLVTSSARRRGRRDYIDASIKATMRVSLTNCYDEDSSRAECGNSWDRRER